MSQPSAPCHSHLDGKTQQRFPKFVEFYCDLIGEAGACGTRCLQEDKHSRRGAPSAFGSISRADMFGAKRNHPVGICIPEQLESLSGPSKQEVIQSEADGFTVISLALA